MLVLLEVASYLSSSSFFPLLALFCWLSLPLFNGELFPLQQEAKCLYFEHLPHFLPFAGQHESRAKCPFFPQLKHDFPDRFLAFSSLFPMALTLAPAVMHCVCCLAGSEALAFSRTAFKVMFLVSNNFFFSSITINFYINCSRKLFSNAALKLQCLAWWRRRTRYVSTGSPSFGAICLNTCLERYVFFSTKMVIQFRINITTYVYAAIYIVAAI